MTQNLVFLWTNQTRNTGAASTERKAVSTEMQTPAWAQDERICRNCKEVLKTKENPFSFHWDLKSGESGRLNFNSNTKIHIILANLKQPIAASSVLNKNEIKWTLDKSSLSGTKAAPGTLVFSSGEELRAGRNCLLLSGHWPHSRPRPNSLSLRLTWCL